ncbi:response regulator transcription factor [Bryobacter aggregatus]|uniref:response regulator transcription factor n=1 Tax=Bryobacter aggregatus TaxID=360054 RepID=UPI0004E20F6C|nr:response regulator transcription factor [Bryobacter aggregatus]
MRVLVVEDEEHLAEGLRFNLEAEGFDVTVRENGEDALREFGEGQPAYDLLVLDVMLPGIDGFEVIKKLREIGEYLPTLMLTARGRAEDVVKGIAAGADDYLAKPFDLGVLIARIKGLMRRREWIVGSAPDSGDRVTINGRVIDFKNLSIEFEGDKQPLTIMEVNFLKYLIAHEGEVVSRADLLDKVWQVHGDTDTRAIDNFVVRLRKYIETDPAQPKCLLTVRGVGYRLERS